MRLDNLSDEELIGIVKSKNEYFNSALGRLYTKYYDALCGFSRRILGNKEDAEDNVNDVFYKFCTNSDFYRNENKATFKSWIFDITHNTAINKLRRKNTRNKFLEEKAGEFYIPPENEFFRDENREILRNELRRMDSSYSEIIYMREFFDMDYNEIEKFLGVPSSTCRGRNKKAVAFLKRSLIEGYGEEQFLS